VARRLHAREAVEDCAIFRYNDIISHADGYNFLPYFKGEAQKGPREEIYYFSQGGELNAIRVQNWKIHFATQAGNIATGTRSTPAWPLLVDLRADPYEKGPNEADLGYLRWYGDNMGTFG
jgi:arylsulfatase